MNYKGTSQINYQIELVRIGLGQYSLTGKIILYKVVDYEKYHQQDFGYKAAG
jgi:hypothetical protein